ncbi:MULTISPECIES: hypothetical protein [Roseomonadaceae]|uniref:Uncharacterized protein n=1 Tax=Falsiroseomonas oleicola TaxID=2801474 RepID=A0ABS6H9R1_9PROT|nr:hypothetical protein [Roseomonas oleicola]MBU8545121.1 hypothetical protein [Roseomonas oleicola]
MPILNPEHLLEQADRLIAAPAAGPPRQVDLRRAISAAYYAVFHANLRAVADQVVGITQRATPRYALVYRRLDHGTVKGCCEDLLKSAMPRKYLPYVTGTPFTVPLKSYAAGFITLQEKRHAADYDPAMRYLTIDARTTIATARATLTSFGAVPADELALFTTLLLCPPR